MSDRDSHGLFGEVCWFLAGIYSPIRDVSCCAMCSSLGSKALREITSNWECSFKGVETVETGYQGTVVCQSD
jgi:hypothetical protein